MDLLFQKRMSNSVLNTNGLEFLIKRSNHVWLFSRKQSWAYDSLRLFKTAKRDPSRRWCSYHHSIGQCLFHEKENPEFQIPEGVELPEELQDVAFYSIQNFASLLKNRKITSEQTPPYSYRSNQALWWQLLRWLRLQDYAWHWLRLKRGGSRICSRGIT